MAKKLTTEDFINRSSQIHNNKFNYSKTVYVRANDKVIIICHQHGEFKQFAKHHITGIGCPKCGHLKTSSCRRKTTEEFIKEAKEVHGERYDYSLVDYKGTHIKVKIICKEHGVFKQTPSTHLNGSGCIKCGIDLTTKLRTKTKDKFIEESISIHGCKYDYSLVNYKNSDTKVKIVCKKHGVFEQSPSSHLHGRGCYKCGLYIAAKHAKENSPGWGATNWEKASKKSKEFDSFKVYIIKCWDENETFYKIGRTFLTTKKRFRNKRFMPYNYEIIKEIIFDTAKEAFDSENKLKRINRGNKYVPSIFFYGRQECFNYIFE